MMIGDKGKALVKRFEGCRLTAYPDPATGGDPWTIGWGATGPDIKRGTVWTQVQADAWLDNRLAHDAEQLTRMIGPAPTTQDQFDAMMCFAYNVGLGNLSASTLLKRHIAGRYADAQAEFARWNKASGKVMLGLTRRRAAEAALYGGQA